MNDWYPNGPHDNRSYGAGVHGVAGVAGGWELRDGAACVARGRECLPFSRTVCDEAAVAYALIALAKRGAAWAEGIDAELARRYRAAHLAMDAWEFDDARRTTATEQEVDALFAAVTATHAALVRGYL